VLAERSADPRDAVRHLEDAVEQHDRSEAQPHEVDRHRHVERDGERRDARPQPEDQHHGRDHFGDIHPVREICRQAVLAERSADPRDAVLSLKQISVAFPKGTKREAIEPVVARFADATRNIGGCGGADKLAADFHGEVVTSDQVKMRDLPPALQRLMMPMQVGQATPPFGSLEEGIRTLVICGRDEPSSRAPSYDDVYNQLNDERVNSRARRYLRDLRRDAVIEFR